MIAAWFVYALLVGCLVAVGTLGLERALRMVALPVRWVWLGGLTATVLLVATAPARAPEAELPAASGSGVEWSTVNATSGAPATSDAGARLWKSRDEARDAVREVLAAAGRGIPDSVERIILLMWIASAAGVLLAGYAANRRISRARRRWPRADLEGVQVRVAPEAGPAVVGLRRPEIVVPRWLLHLGSDSRRLVLAHEQQHLRAHDPLLLAAAWLLVALLPWHPAAWWMLARLRLAVELDCDSRVLRQGMSARSYGTLLIELAGRSSGLRVGIPARAEGASHLERRLLAMSTRNSRFVAARAGGLGIAALAVLFAACEAALPTAADIQQMDVASAEAAARRAALIPAGEENAVYTVDGAEVTAEEARSLAPDAIVAVAVTRTTSAAEPARIMIVTREGERQGFAVLGTPGFPGSATLRADSIAFRLEQPVAGEPLYIVNGEVVEGVRMIPAPADIQSINVLKGASATSVYGARGADGVVIIERRDGDTAQRLMPAEGSAQGVIATGYGTLRPAETAAEPLRGVTATGYATLRRADIAAEPLHAVDAAALGVEPGRSGAVQVRAVSPSNAPPPLYVVDGVVRPNFSLSEIPPADIQSISVIKDATAATARYGSRGANGVIEITTKRAAAAAEAASTTGR